MTHEDCHRKRVPANGAALTSKGPHDKPSRPHLYPPFPIPPSSCVMQSSRSYRAPRHQETICPAPVRPPDEVPLPGREREGLVSVWVLDRSWLSASREISVSPRVRINPRLRRRRTMDPVKTVNTRHRIPTRHSHAQTWRTHSKHQITPSQLGALRVLLRGGMQYVQSVQIFSTSCTLQLLGWIWKSLLCPEVKDSSYIPHRVG